jgi:hypothetical protein
VSEPQAPHLSVVEPLPDEAPRESGSRLRTALPWLLLLLALAFAWLWLSQVERSRQLERRIAALETELTDARDALATWQARMDAVRDGIDRVAGEVDALRSLTALPPASPPAAVDAPEAAEAPPDAATAPE